MGQVGPLTLPPRLWGTLFPPPLQPTLFQPQGTRASLRLILTDVKSIEHIAGPFRVIPPAPKEDRVIDEDS